MTCISRVAGLDGEGGGFEAVTLYIVGLVEGGWLVGRIRVGVGKLYDASVVRAGAGSGGNTDQVIGARR